MRGVPRTILVTAFEPFGGRQVNRSQQVLEHVARAAASSAGLPRGTRIVTRTLPVRFDRLEAVLERALACKPDAVLLLGESGPASELRLERVAVNRIEARIPDNAGKQPLGSPVLGGGPAAYFASASLRPALAAVRRTGTPAALSNDAGSFACNAVYYLALHKLHRRRTQVPALFVHLPIKARTVGIRQATRAVLALVRQLGRLERGAGAPRSAREATGRAGARKA